MGLGEILGGVFWGETSTVNHGELLSAHKSFFSSIQPICLREREGERDKERERALVFHCIQTVRQQGPKCINGWP